MWDPSYRELVRSTQFDEYENNIFFFASNLIKCEDENINMMTWLSGNIHIN